MHIYQACMNMDNKSRILVEPTTEQNNRTQLLGRVNLQNFSTENCEEYAIRNFFNPKQKKITIGSFYKKNIIPNLRFILNHPQDEEKKNQSKQHQIPRWQPKESIRGTNSYLVRELSRRQVTTQGDHVCPVPQARDQKPEIGPFSSSAIPI